MGHNILTLPVVLKNCPVMLIDAPKLFTALIMLPRFVYYAHIMLVIIHEHTWPCGLLGKTLVTKINPAYRK